MEIRTTKIAIPTFQYHKRTCRFNFDPNKNSADLNYTLLKSLLTADRIQIKYGN